MDVFLRLTWQHDLMLPGFTGRRDGPWVLLREFEPDGSLAEWAHQHKEAFFAGDRIVHLNGARAPPVILDELNGAPLHVRMLVKRRPADDAENVGCRNVPCAG